MESAPTRLHNVSAESAKVEARVVNFILIVLCLFCFCDCVKREETLIRKWLRARI